MQIVYADAPDEGFFDPELGAARRAAFEFAAEQWATALGGTVPVVVEATMDSLGGTGATATLASAGAVTIHRNLAPVARNTWYGAALASQIIEADINGPDVPEIVVAFNADVDGPEILGSVGWYYGLDAQPGNDIDFVTLALHELGHGLNFFEVVDSISGGWRADDDPGIFDRMLFRPGVGSFADMRAAERLAAIVSGQLLWIGPNVVAFNGSAVPVYAPDPFQPGASIGHWDTSLSPDEVIEPFYTTAVHDLGLLLPAMMDMGWELAVETPTPRASPATATPTEPPRPTQTPETTPRARRAQVYVTNFDDGTVSVIDPASYRVTATIAVGDGPNGIAAAPDGSEIYVANFHEGTLSVVQTRTSRVVETVAVGESANGVAVTPDGAFVVVTDTAAERVAVVATGSNTVRAQVKAGLQPSGVALDPEGKLAFVTNFGGKTVTVIDLDERLRRAIIPLTDEHLGLAGIAIAPQTGLGYVTAFYSRSVTLLNAPNLTRGVTFYPPFRYPNRPESVVMSRNGAVAYVSNYDNTTGAGAVLVLDTATNEAVLSYSTGEVPEALALSPDDRFLYVANAGADKVTVIDTELRRVIANVRVGRAPMGVAVAAVPEDDNPCEEDCATETPTRTLTPTPTATASSAPTETPTALPTATIGVPCEGDCDGDTRVSVDELVEAVRMALGERQVESCGAVDCDDNGSVTIDELIRAVDRALNGCST